MNQANFQAVYNQLSPSMKRFDDFGRDTIVKMFEACNKITDPHLRKTAVIATLSVLMFGCYERCTHK